MKRPFIITGVISLIISWISLHCNTSLISLLLLCFAACATLLLTIFRKKTSDNSNYPVILVTLLLVFILSIVNIEYIYKPVSLLDDTTADVKATVISEPSTQLDDAYYYFKGEHPLLNRPIKFSLPSENLGLEIGDQVNMTVNFSELSDSFKSHNLSEGIFISSSIESVNSVAMGGSKTYTALGRLRLYIKNEIFNDVRGDNGAVLIALLTGDRDHISHSLYDKTKICGVTHILVVSGLHLSILSGAILTFADKIKLGRKISVFIIFALIAIIIAICNFHTSALRSAIMSIIMLSGSLINRKPDGLNSLGFAVTVMVLLNPFVAGSAAFLLSVFATLGVIFVAPMVKYLTEDLRFRCRFSRLLNSAVDIIIISVCAFICVLPITIYYYGYTSLISPIVTMLISAAVEVALILTALGVLVSLIPIVSVFSSPLVMISGIISAYISRVIDIFGSTNSFLLVIDPSYAQLCFIFSASAVLILWIFYRKKLKERKDEDASLGKGSQKLT